MVKRGFARDDLFVCVHEQFMTDTASVADIVLPATMFVEHDDLYPAGGSQYILLGPKLIEPPGECRSNHDVICALAKRLGAEHPGFAMTPRELIDVTLQKSGWGTLADLEANRWIDCQPDFATAHYLNGFGYPDGKFRFKPNWPKVPFTRGTAPCPRARCRAARPLGRDRGGGCRASVPAGDVAGARFPQFDFHRDADLARQGAAARGDDPSRRCRGARGRGRRPGRARQSPRHGAGLHAQLFDGVRRGVLIAESLWPNTAYADGRGINTLTGADSIAPFGGAAFHDNKVWLRKAAG